MSRLAELIADVIKDQDIGLEFCPGLDDSLESDVAIFIEGANRDESWSYSFKDMYSDISAYDFEPDKLRLMADSLESLARHVRNCAREGKDV